MRRILTLLVLLLALAGCGGDGEVTVTFATYGYQHDSHTIGEPCSQATMPVEVRNEEGTLVAQDQLAWSEGEAVPPYRSGGAPGCTAVGTLELPKANFYTFSFPNQLVEDATVPRDEVADGEVTIAYGD